MSEEEIIKEIESLSPSEEAIQNLLDLYNKEKEKNKELNDINFRVNYNLLTVVDELNELKEKYGILQEKIEQKHLQELLEERN